MKLEACGVGECLWFARAYEGYPSLTELGLSERVSWPEGWTCGRS